MGEISMNLSRLLHNEAEKTQGKVTHPGHLGGISSNCGFSLILCLSNIDVVSIGKYVCCCNSYTCKPNTTECSVSLILILFTNVI